MKHLYETAKSVFVPDMSGVRFFQLITEEMDRRNIIGDYHWCPCRLFGAEDWRVVDGEWERDEAAVQRLMEIGR